jgi:hypothetical protein
MFIVMTVSLNSFAEPLIVEFDEATEIICHTEIKNFKCTNNADEEILECVEANKLKLSQKCRKMHDTKRTNQKR